MRTLSNWPLRAKLLAVLALPTVAAVILAVFRVYDGVQETRDFGKVAKLVDAERTSSTVINALQDERRAMSAWVVSGRPPNHGRLDARIAKTNRVVGSAGKLTDAVDGVDDPAISAAYAQATTRLGSLGKLRQLAATKPGFKPEAATAVYSEIIDVLLSANVRADDSGTSQRQNALTAVMQAREDSAKQNTYLLNAATRGSFEEEELQQLQSSGADLVAAINRFTNLATPADKATYSNTMRGPEVSAQFQLQQLATQRARAGLPVGISPADVTRNADVTVGKFRTVSSQVRDNMAAYVQDRYAQARTALIITAAVLALGLAFAITLMLVVARILLRQLRTLRSSALDVAGEQLPRSLQRIMSSPDPHAASREAIEPVPVHTTEEVGQVARAFDEVHGQAIRLAAEQALLRDNVNGILVNLSRRSQGLVQRQLGVIDRLEEQEQDPDRLTDLFELDHLSTRLRRNGESLLVLSGSGPANAMSRPTRAADIVGAAVSEIEEYTRVDVGSVPDVSVHGQAVHDLVHLLAEVLDNATFFSEHSTPVHVRAAMTRNRELAIQISDTGVGMTEEQLEKANRDLREPPDLDVSVTRRMGLYVVARLGKRHDIEVRLRENEDIDGGVVARVKVPENLLIETSSELPPQVSVAGVPAGSRARDREPGRSAVPLQRDSSAPGADTGTARRPAVDDAETMVMPPARPAPGELGPGNQLLPELDQPLSLDSLMAGGDDAAAIPEPAHRNGSANGSANAALSSIDANQVSDLVSRRPSPGAAVPRNEPGTQARRDRNGAQARHEDRASNNYGAQNDQSRHEELVRKGTPIYQEMMSRWLSEADDPLDAGAPAAGEGGTGGRAGSANGRAAGWHSPSDEGWEAASLLSEAKGEEITPAGLPKRIPNAYLVPGSVDEAAGGPQARQDAAPQGAQGGSQGAAPLGDREASRAAEMAREKMAKFQRGFLAGRSEVAEPGAAGPAFGAAGGGSAGAADTDSAQRDVAAQRDTTAGDIADRDKEQG